ncbi:hypothetical protein HZB07_03325 [Candidatus Saganbacteria bacterium]|nr:hypothetical protein [Candidatus Saganbacteria bacterium]
MRAAVYKCSHCKFEDTIAVRDLKLLYTFIENDITTYPKLECDICHRVENYPSELKEVPDNELPEHPDITAMRKAGKLDEFIAQYKQHLGLK